MARVASPSRPASSAVRKRTHFSDRPVRNSLLTAASLVVFAAIALFVLGAAQPAATTTSFHLTSYLTPDDDVVVYGKVTGASNDVVSGANVVIYQVVRGRHSVLAQVATSPQGLYRVTLKDLSQSTLYVQVSKRLGGMSYLGTLGIRARPDRAYDVSVVMAFRVTLFSFPVFSY